MLDKRGSHIGIVLSFILFITSILFLILLLSPMIKTNQSKQFILDGIKLGVLEDVEEEVMTFSINIDGTVNKDCIKFNNIVGSIEELTDLNRLVIKNGSEKLAYNVNGNLLSIRTGINFNGMLKFYQSDESDGPSGDVGTDCTPDPGYTIEYITSKEYSTESKIINLFERYETGYETLKQELGIPEDVDFSVGFRYDNGTLIGGGGEELPTDIYVKEFAMQYLDSNANINTGFLIIKVW